MAGSSRGATKRLMTELQSYQRDPNEELLDLGPADEDVMHWRAVMKGVEGTAYEGGTWLLDIHVPPSYPNSPPTVRFVTPICHPNVDFKTGEICLDLLKTNWTPAYTIATTMTSVHQLLTSAEPDSPLNVDIAQLFRQGDYKGQMIKTLELCGYWTDVFGRHKLAKVAGAVSSCFAAFREKPAKLGVQMTKGLWGDDAEA